MGLFVLFFGALISAMLAPLLLLLPAEWQWTGWQWFGLGLAVWLAVVALLGAIARWGYVRCRAVVFVGAAGWPRASSVLVGAVAALVLLATFRARAPASCLRARRCPSRRATFR